MTTLSSKQNVHVKQIRALQARQHRDRTGLFFIEGVRSVLDAYEVDAAIETLVVAPDLFRSQAAYAALDAAYRAGTTIIETSADVFGHLASAASLKYGWQGVGAVVRQRWHTLPMCANDGSLWVALDAIQDPGNLGTILRTCEAIGANGVILLGGTTDPYDPQSVRASLGAVFTQRLVRTAWDDLAGWAERAGFALVGTSGAATLDYRKMAYPSRMVLVMGSERHGLSDVQQRGCDAVVSIPMVGAVDSLNLGVATGIVLYEILAQHRTT